MITTNTIVNIALILVLIGCLLNVPYGYYQFAKVAVFALGAYNAYLYSVNRKHIQSVAYGLISILFFPFIKSAFHRSEWQTIDKVVMGVVVVMVVIDIMSQRKR